MNITKQNIDDLNAVIKLQLSKDDYEGRVNNVLSDYRKKARIDGFRPGKVPAGLINKMYKRPVMVDEINKILSESINEYIKKEDLNILGDPLPSMDQQKTIDWENDTDFEFAFEIGLSPKFDLTLSQKDKVAYYEITVDDKMIDGYVSTHARRYGKFVDGTVVEENELLKGDLIQLDENGNALEGGIVSTDISLYLELAKDEDEKKAFVSKKAGDSVTFDLLKAFPNNFELANLLKIDKEKVSEVTGKFKMEIKGISKFEKAEMNQELFDKVYGEGVVASEDEFKKKIESEVKQSLTKESDYKFLLDSKEYLLKKLDLKLPAEFMKKWLEYANEGKLSKEQIEKEYPLFENDMKWQLIKNKIIKDNNVEVKQEEIISFAKEVTRSQFAQYGLANVPDEQLESYALGMLKKESEARRIIDKLMEDKAVAFIKEQVKLDTKNVNSEEFEKLFQA
jgi:trigger factor